MKRLKDKTETTRIPMALHPIFGVNFLRHSGFSQSAGHEYQHLRCENKEAISTGLGNPDNQKTGDERRSPVTE